MTVYNMIESCTLDGIAVIVWLNGNDVVRREQRSTSDIRKNQLYNNVCVYQWEVDSENLIFYFYIQT